jgi:hypothetical protein
MDIYQLMNIDIRVRPSDLPAPRIQMTKRPTAELICSGYSESNDSPLLPNAVIWRLPNVVR